MSAVDPNVLERDMLSLSRAEYVAAHRYPFLVLLEEVESTTDERRGFVTVVEGKGEAAATRFRLFAVTRKKNKHFQGKVFVGRTNTNDIVLDDARISKLHAYFDLDADGQAVSVADAGSTNGTRLDGEPLPPRVSTPISFGQVVAFGPFVFSFVSTADVYVQRSRINIRHTLAGVTGEARRA